MNLSVPRLSDRFGRHIEYLRISVTDRCDLRCTYCMPKDFRNFEEPRHWLSFEEIIRLVAAFARFGVTKVRLTGGEPLLRRGLPELARELSSVPGIQDLSLSTNGTQLARHAAALRAAGISRLNVSLDSLRPERVRSITCRDALPKVLEGLMTAKDQGFEPIKINMVVLAGVNDDEVEDMAEFCMAHGFVLRLIEAMPMGDSGKAAAFLDLRPVRRRLEERYGLVEGIVPGAGPARYLLSRDGRLSIGFITPLSQHFCAACNRVRLSVDGTLFTCLGQEHRSEFRSLLRAGATESDLEEAIRQAIAQKPERHEFREAPHKIHRIMARTGG